MTKSSCIKTSDLTTEQHQLIYQSLSRMRQGLKIFEPLDAEPAHIFFPESTDFSQADEIIDKTVKE